MSESNLHTPIFHFTSPTGQDCMPFDPNGAVYFNGRYHLGYIYQLEGRHFWGHVSSTDLVHWQLQPPMLSPGPEAGIFSGNAFVDRQGRVVLSYHGLGDESVGYPAGNCLAVGQDPDLNQFEKLAANPVMRNPAWDPHTWLEDGVYYSISGGMPGTGSAPSLYRSTDDTLQAWELMGPLMASEMPEVYPDEDISCPDLFELDGKKILLCISHSRGARYYVGRFENCQFYPESHHRMMWPGGTFFAPETLLDNRNRRILWAWVLGSPSTMSLPRVLSLDSEGTMQITPVEELRALRSNHQILQSLQVAANSTVELPEMRGDCKELHFRIDPKQAEACGVIVRMSPDGEEQTVVAYVPKSKLLRVELGKSSLDKTKPYRTFAMSVVLPAGTPDPQVEAQEAPFELKPGELLELTIFLDHSIVEFFANGRQCITQRIWPTREDSLGVALFARCGDIAVQTLNSWDMGAIEVRS